MRAIGRPKVGVFGAALVAAASVTALATVALRSAGGEEDVGAAGKAFVRGSAGEAATPSRSRDRRWKVLPIRSKEEFDQGKIGGEAEQHPHSITRSPSDPSVICWSHDVGGAWRSTDAGNSWKKTLGRNLYLQFGQSIQVDPVNPVFIDGDTGGAAKLFRKIVHEYPGTPSAVKAAEYLEILE